MKRRLPKLIISAALMLSTGGSFFGQEIGATAETVEALDGKPAMTRRSGDREVWMYADGRRVILQNGIVAGVEGPGVEGIVVAGAARPSAAPEVAALPVNAPAPESVPERASAPAPGLARPVVTTVVTGEEQAVDFPEEEEIGLLPALVGLAVVLVWVVASLWFLVLAFKEGFWWGMGCLCLPVVPLVFAHRNWSAVKKPFCLSAVASGLLVGINALL